MSCKHLRELFDICQRNHLKLSSSDVIRITCPTCGSEEVCPSLLCEQYDERHRGEDLAEKDESAG